MTVMDNADWKIHAGLLIFTAIIGLVIILAVFASMGTKFSSTAQAFATCRYLGTFEDNHVVPSKDYNAHLFVSATIKFLAKFYPSRILLLFMINQKHSGLYQYVTSCTKIIDEEIHNILRRDHFRGDNSTRVKQLVLLGPAFDTKAIRHTEFLQKKNVTVFEVDLSKNSAYQQKKLKSIPKSSYQHVKFCSVELDRVATVEKKLIAAGYDPSTPALFVLEGQSQWMNDGIINDLFAVMRKNNRANLIMDFVPHWYEAKKKQRRAVGNFEINVQDGNLQNFLGTRGFVLAKHYGKRELQMSLLTGTVQVSLGALVEPNHILVAELDEVAAAIEVKKKQVASKSSKSSKQCPP